MSDKKNLPVTQGQNIPANPLNDMMLNGMPGLPAIIQNAMPVPLPQMNFNQGPISMVWHNFKAARMERATRLEAEIAENSNRAVHAKLDSIHAVVTFSSKIQDSLEEFVYKRDFRNLTIERMKLENYKLQVEATQAGWEARISEMDFKIRERQFKEIYNDSDD